MIFTFGFKLGFGYNSKKIDKPTPIANSEVWAEKVETALRDGKTGR